jgi:aspartate aminotransferase
VSPPGAVSRRTAAIQSRLAPVLSVITDPLFEARLQDPQACDFLFGNPQEMALPGFVQSLKRWVTPQNKDWFAYKMTEPAPRRAVAEGLRAWRGIDYSPEDVFLTNGAFAGLAVVINAIVDPGDEVVFISPPWFFYETLILHAGGEPVRVRVAADYDLDVEAIAAALTPRTRALIVNSPHNPTGRIYPPQTLARLAHVLQTASTKHGHPIYLLSDEAYSRILYDDRKYTSPTTFYPHSFLIYTYGKTLLTPGQRLGYIVLPPEMPGREAMREALLTSQLLTGYAWPNALLQHALPDLDRLSIDIHHLQQKRDRTVAALHQIGYEVHVPEGTFYLLPRSPLPDDLEFVRRLAARHVYCLPGVAVEMPGSFRISLTASDEMIERSIPQFAALFEEARQRLSPAHIRA